MPKIRINVSAALFTCRRCKAEHNNPLKHACVVSFRELGKPASMRKAAKNR